MHLRGKHFINTQDWNKKELQKVIDTANYLKIQRMLGVSHNDICLDKTLFMLFFEESTRTRNAFEAGITQLGGHAHYLTPKATQIDHGEGPQDTVEVLGSYGHGIGVRNTSEGGNRYMNELAKHAKIPVYNMQCDLYHPTQALADMFTIQEHFGQELRGRKFVISWTSAPNYIRPLSMAHSLVQLMPRFGLDVTLAHPPEFKLNDDIIETARKNAAETGSQFEIVDDMDAACEGADIVYAKGWGPINYTQDEKEGLALIDKYPGWCVDERRMNIAKPESIYMHCMPADRGIEVTDAVADGPHSVIYEEAENRLHLQKALMALTMI